MSGPITGVEAIHSIRVLERRVLQIHIWVVGLKERDREKVTEEREDEKMGGVILYSTMCIRKQGTIEP